MKEGSFIAGAVGEAATKLVDTSFSSAPPLLDRSEGRLVVSDDARRLCEAGTGVGLLGALRAPNTDAAALRWDLPAIESALFASPGGLDDRLGGHFGLFYVDFARRRVVLATDRFGSFAVYYRIVGDGVAFSNRADALFGDKEQLSNQAIYDYLYFHCLPGPATIHPDVRRLEPGTVLTWEDGRLSEDVYWQRRPKSAPYRSFDRAKADFRRLLSESVAAECGGSDTGAFLSGGTDSSTVVGVLAERSEAPVRSYSIGFDVPGYDEAGYARLAARHFGAEHTEYYVTPDDLVERLPAVAARLDQPFGNSSLVPAVICAERAAEDGITTLLAGDGGDELFGGNVRYAKQKVFGWYETVPRPIRRTLIEPAVTPDFASSMPLLRKLKSYVEQARIPLPDRLETYNLLRKEGPANFLCPDWLSTVNPGNPEERQRAVWNELSADNIVDQMIEFDWKFTLADNDLRKVRWAGDITGVSIGFPLLSDGLSDFALALKPSWKVRGFRLRWFFKEALKDFLPREIIEKKKHGFGLPFGTWACEHDGLKQMSRSTLRQLVDRRLLRSNYVNTLLDERLPRYPHYYGELVWVLMMLELWIRSHCDAWHA